MKRFTFFSALKLVTLMLLKFGCVGSSEKGLCDCIHMRATLVFLGMTFDNRADFPENSRPAARMQVRDEMKH